MHFKSLQSKFKQFYDEVDSSDEEPTQIQQNLSKELPERQAYTSTKKGYSHL